MPASIPAPDASESIRPETRFGLLAHLHDPDFDDSMEAWEKDGREILESFDPAIDATN
jgi:hypothetical protein